MAHENADLSTVDVGFTMPTFERTVGLENWNRYAAVNDEFVPIHMDDEAGREAGYPTAFGMGNLHVGFMHAAFHDWLGDEGWVRKLEVRFRRPSTRGIVNRVRGEVTSVERSEGQIVMELDMRVEDGDGEPLTTGSATVVARIT